MQLRAGQKLHSAVSEVQVVVVRAPSADVEVTCGGVAVVSKPGGGSTSGDALGEGPLLGKRYVDDEAGLEVLCSRGGDGTLAVDGRPLLVKGAKPLPSSD